MWWVYFAVFVRYYIGILCIRSTDIVHIVVLDILGIKCCCSVLDVTSKATEELPLSMPLSWIKTIYYLFRDTARRHWAWRTPYLCKKWRYVWSSDVDQLDLTMDWDSFFGCHQAQKFQLMNKYNKQYCVSKFILQTRIIMWTLWQ